MPSVSQIAKHANVSKSTVSLALNGKPGISAQMRQRVLTAVNELNSAEIVSQQTPSEKHPNRAVAKSIMVMHPAILNSSEVFKELLKGIECGALAHNLQLRLAVNEAEQPKNHITNLYLTDKALRPSGILIIGARRNEPLVNEAVKKKIPVVLVGRQSEDSLIAAVGRDEEAGGFMAAQHLISLGHKAIAFVGGDVNYTFTHQRIRGYKKALEAHDIPVIEQRVLIGDGTISAEKLLKQSPDITAAIFINDSYANQGLKVLQAAGKTIPQDLSVICFDDTQLARSFKPALTTISYPHFQEGVWAVKTLHDLIQQPKLKSCQILFHASLTQRESCIPHQGESM